MKKKTKTLSEAILGKPVSYHLNMLVDCIGMMHDRKMRIHATRTAMVSVLAIAMILGIPMRRRN